VVTELKRGQVPPELSGNRSECPDNVLIERRFSVHHPINAIDL
jgi:hypothetical protein